MGECRMQKMLAFLSLMLVTLPPIYGWGTDGHSIICKIAQTRLSEEAADAVKQLLPKWAEDDLGSVCSWADQVKFRYRWSSPLHFINTPETCSYQYKRDCKDEDGEAGRCVAGAINNYTSQLLTYNSAADKAEYNLTESLLFLVHFMGDIHQPLHVGFASDKGGNTIDVHWYKTKQVLHHVWDTNIIETAEERFYNSNVDGMVDAIQQNITNEWADQVKRWETCSLNKTACPDIYASEGIKAACDWAYKGVKEESVLEDDSNYLLEVSTRGCSIGSNSQSYFWMKKLPVTDTILLRFEMNFNKNLAFNYLSWVGLLNYSPIKLLPYYIYNYSKVTNINK